VKVGLVVNPVAGLGGAVGLKGTDGAETVAEALKRGAVPQAGARARRAMALLAQRVPGAAVTVAPGALGADWVAGLDLRRRCCGSGRPRAARATRARRWRRCGGMTSSSSRAATGRRGTWRGGCRRAWGCLGIPCGVKMHSGVFAVSPEAAGALLADILSDPARVPGTMRRRSWTSTRRRCGRAARAAALRARARAGRAEPDAGGEGRAARRFGVALAGAAAEVVAGMEPGTLYVIGPGTSAGAVMRRRGMSPRSSGSTRCGTARSWRGMRGRRS
jgi:predicted polyphosphate/ATP-dependent NAD kinase